MWDCRSFSLHRVWVLSCLGCDPIGSARLTQDSGGFEGQEALVVSPRTLDFGTISVIDEGTTRARFLVTNAGDDTIAVHGHDEIIALNGDADLVFEVAADPILNCYLAIANNLVSSSDPTLKAIGRQSCRSITVWNC